MKMTMPFHSFMYALLVLGILLSACSVVVACLDARDFFSALFADRGSEQIGLGIRGIQLFHFLAGGITVSASSGGFLAMNLAMKKDENPFDSISLDSLSRPHPAALSAGTMERLEDAMGSIFRTEEDSDLVREIAEFKSTNSHHSGTNPTQVFQKIDPRSVDSLIDGASLLLADEGRITDGPNTDMQ
jgi:hypothetical protein